MSQQETPLHHIPNVLGLDQATQVPADAWEAFFDTCWDWYEEILRRRAAKQAEANNEELTAQKQRA